MNTNEALFLDVTAPVSIAETSDCLVTDHAQRDLGRSASFRLTRSMRVWHEPAVRIQAERRAHATGRPADLTDSQRVVAGIGASNVIRTLVRHPDLLNAWLGLGTKLLFTVTITQGHVDGSHFSFEAPLTAPLEGRDHLRGCRPRRHPAPRGHHSRWGLVPG
jgi:hypothetical protein